MTAWLFWSFHGRALTRLFHRNIGVWSGVPPTIPYHVCHDGQWSRQPGEKRCTCPPATPLEGAASGLVRQRDEDKDGKILCWPPQNTQASCSFPQMYRAFVQLD